jgi:hypothetical protein
MRFFPAVGLVFIALLFVNFYPPLRSPLRFSTIESGLPQPSRPTPLQILTATPAPTQDMTSPPVLAPAVETKPAVEAQAAVEVPAKVEPVAKSSREVLAKVGPVARAARAEAPPKNRRFTRSRGYKQTPSFATFSIKGY